jgi:hypothetical protein
VKSVDTPLGSIDFQVGVHGRAEMQILELPRTLQNGMTLERVIACLLVVEPHINGTDLAFSARLNNEDSVGSSEPGEYLDCVSWESPEWSLSLGTEDGDALSQRLKCPEFNTNTYPVTCSKSGIELRLTGLEGGKVLSFHFIIAYKMLPDERGCSTWFAVDVPHNVANKDLIMNPLDLLPPALREQSISQREIVLPTAAALEAIDFIESQGAQILGWEGWIKDAQGRVGHGSAPQGTVSLEQLSVQEAAQLCRVTISLEAVQWAQDNPDTTDVLHFCITVRT